MAKGHNFGPLSQRGPPELGLWSAADTALCGGNMLFGSGSKVAVIS